MWRKEIGLIICGLVTACSACSRSNNLLLGRVEAKVGGHTVVVTDCYRTSVTPPERVGGPSEQSYRFMPCRDADVLIRNDELIVNGSSYVPEKASATGGCIYCEGEWGPGFSVERLLLTLYGVF